MDSGFVEQKSIVERKENTYSISIIYLEIKLLNKTYKNLNLRLKNSITKKAFD